MITISLGNHKLPESVAIFNLPAEKTCPGKTEECVRYCYAKKAEYIYWSVVRSRYRNLWASQHSWFVDVMVKRIKKLPPRVRYFRIHESGDFYSQEYADKWTEIMRRSDLQFLAYTKSPYRPKMLSNFALVESILPDGRENVASTREEAEELAWRWSGEICPYPDKRIKCMVHCHKCLRNKYVIFVRH